MVRTKLRAMLTVLVLIGLSSLLSARAEAAHPDIFYNFYAGPKACATGSPTQLYTAPLQTPPLVGHTWNTYPPLMPHEFMYRHHRTYYKHNRDGGYTTSHVRYR